MEFLPQAFAAMGAYPQFILYRTERTSTGKFTKLPCDYRTGMTCNAHEPDNWTTAANAIQCAKAFGYGVGFVFTELDPFWFLDIDDCIVNYDWSTVAKEVHAALSQCAVEISHSRKGLHIFGTGNVPVHTCKNSDFGLEFYTSGRFVALTGDAAQGDSGYDATAALTGIIIPKYFTAQPAAPSGGDWRDSPVDGAYPIPEDDALIEAALKAKSSTGVFGGSATFSDLWHNNVEPLIKSYPSKTDVYDRSTADTALAQHLAFWTGNDCERIVRLMRRSGLYRDKWEREDYLPRTIRFACGRQLRFFDNRANVNEKAVDRQAFQAVDQQPELFKGCVYVTDEHLVYTPLSPILLSPQQFNVLYGGHLMPLDHANQKLTRKAFEAFTESQVNRYPQVNTTCFRPDLEPGTIVDNAVNIYRPLPILETPGDASPFFDLVAKMIPNEEDRLIFLSYFAAVLQYPGKKFTWAIVMQGTEGNGKSLLSGLLATAVGLPHTHFPKADELTSKFNDWSYGVRLVVVEDMRVGRPEVYEAMKVMITQPYQEIEPKGGRKVMRQTCANFIINTNHLDGIKKERNNRRYCILYTAQQSFDDIIAAGMGGEYFPNFVAWVNNGGQEIVTYTMRRFPIPDKYNPATHCHRAPITTSTEQAIENSYNAVQQEILEAVEQGRPGFRKGYISSIQLNLLLKETSRERISYNNRKEMLAQLGYILHPGLPKGRVNNPVLPDGNKPRLFILKNHPHTTITKPAEIEKAYEDSQRD